MKQGDVLRKEREGRGLSRHADMSQADVAQRLGISEAEYAAMEDGQSPIEAWGYQLAQIAIALEVPTSRLLAESGKFADTKPGQAARLIQGHRERKGKSQQEIADAMGISLEEYQQVESEGGHPDLEKYGPLLLGFAEVIEQPVFNLFYPCGLPYRELDDYP